MCNGTTSVLSSEPAECSANPTQHQGLKVRQVVVRELEGLEFPALVLRVHEDEADVVYIDDGQIEHDVPIEELNVSADVQTPKAEIDEIWRKALDSVASSYSDDEDDAPTTNSEQGGKYIAADGTLIISHVDEKAASEQLASTCASPNGEPEDKKDDNATSEDCESLSDSSEEGQPEPKSADFSSDSSDDDQPSPSKPNSQRAERLEMAQFCGTDGVELRKQGQLNEAERQFRRSIDIYEEELGEDHPYTLTSRNNLANLLTTTGKLQDAEIEYRRCLASKVEQLGTNHPVVATTQYNLGLLLSRRGNLEEAEEALREALRIQVQFLGEENAEAVKTSRSLCRVLLKQGKSVDGPDS